MYNLLYYSKNFRKTTGSFWNYYPDMPANLGQYDPNPNPLDAAAITLRKRIFYTIKDSESFNHTTKLVDTLPGPVDLVNNDVETELEDIKIIAPLKNLSKFIFNLNFLIINTEIEVILKWSQNCVLTEKAERTEKAQTQNPLQPFVDEVNRPKDLKFNIADCKLYAPVVILKEKYENKL